jgi:hypothetical protein
VPVGSNLRDPPRNLYRFIVDNLPRFAIRSTGLAAKSGFCRPIRRVRLDGQRHFASERREYKHAAQASVSELKLFTRWRFVLVVAGNHPTSPPNSAGFRSLAIEVQCEKCGQTLRAGETHIGKRARCPKCGAAVLITAPGGGSAPAPAEAAAPQQKPADAAAQRADAAAQWFVRADADEFGPIAKSELDEWAKEGRLDADCQVRSEQWPADGWKSAVAVYPALATDAKNSTAVAPEGDEIKLSPLDEKSSQAKKAEPKKPAANPDNPFANLEIETGESALGDIEELAQFDFKKSKKSRAKAADTKSASTLTDDDLQVAQPGVLDEVLEHRSAKANVKLASTTASGGAGALSAIADTADQMQSSVQAVAFLTFGGCALAAIVGIFWVARSIPLGLWAFTTAGVSLIVVAVLAGLAAKKLLDLFHRIDAFAEKAGSQELARQMDAAGAFWKSAMIAVVVSLVLAVLSLLAFAFVPIEHK